MTRIVIIGGGPAGYEAALVAAQLGAEVTVVERDGIGGASGLTDCVPSKTLIAPAGAMTAVRASAGLLQGAEFTEVDLDLAKVNSRVRGLAIAQSADIHARLTNEGVRILAGQGRLAHHARGNARPPCRGAGRPRRGHRRAGVRRRAHRDRRRPAGAARRRAGPRADPRLAR